MEAVVDALPEEVTEGIAPHSVCVCVCVWNNTKGKISF